MAKITTEHILLHLLRIIIKESDKPEFAKSICVNTNHALFPGSDGSSSAIIHTNLTLHGDEVDLIYKLQSDLNKLLVDELMNLFRDHIYEAYSDDSHQVTWEKLDDFSEMVKAIVFEDQTCYWAQVTCTDTAIIVTLTHYPQ